MSSFRILTFGCKVNQCDSQILRETLTSWGLKEVDAGRHEVPEPHLVVINTCTVTGSADAKFRKALRRARRENPQALIAITGCHVKKPGANGRLPGADILFGTNDFSVLADFLGQRGLAAAEVGAQHAAPFHHEEQCEEHAPLPQTYFAEHTRAFLKVQDGCDCFCTYCIVPLVRPTLWSERPENVVSAINGLARKGYKEVVLTGIHLGFFGRDSARGGLDELLVRVEEQCEVERVRLSSVEVNEVSEQMVELLASSKKFCHHLHLPLQSGDEAVLRTMKRRYSAGFFMERVGQIRQRIPDIGITTDLMVGFPGETEAQFERTCRLVEQLEFAKIHVFRFSQRPGTAAAGMRPTIPAAETSRRARQLISVGEDAARRFKQRFIGQPANVLVESVSDGGVSVTGLTSNYLRTNVLDASPDSVNKILRVRLRGIEPHTGITIAGTEGLS